MRIECEVNESSIEKKINNLFDDDVRIKINTLYAQLIDEYVPFKSGDLSRYEITPEYVRYPQKYARYQYMGEVYGPNLIGRESDGSVGWRSPEHKHPTGRELGKQGSAVLKPVWKRNPDGSYTKADPKDLIPWNFGYTKSTHPLASHHWDKVAMKKKLPLFLAGVAKILTNKARELYG